jgi:hypothetical protein
MLHYFKKLVYFQQKKIKNSPATRHGDAWGRVGIAPTNF